jgi:chromosome segregation ATPase
LLEEEKYYWDAERSKLLNEIEKLKYKSQKSNETEWNRNSMGQKDEERELEELNQQIAELTEENEQLHEKVFQLRDEKQGLEEQLDNYLGKYRNSETRNLGLETELMNSKRKEEDLVRLEEQRRLMDQKNELIKKQSAEMRELNERLLRLSDDVTQRNIVISELRERMAEERRLLETKDGVISDLERNLSFYMKYKEEVEKENENLIETYESKISELTQELQKVKNLYQSAKSREEEVVQSFEKIQTQYKSVDDDSQKLAQSFEVTKRNLKESKEKVKTLSEEMKKLADTKDLERRELQLEYNSVKKELSRLEHERSQDKENFSSELKKLINLNSQQLEMLRAENKELEGRLMGDARKRAEDEEKWRVREKALQEELERIESLRKSKSKRKGPAEQLASELERVVSQKSHEIVDLTSEVNKLGLKVEGLEKENQTLNRKVRLQEEDSKYSKEKCEQLLGKWRLTVDKVKMYQTMESIQEKSDLEIVKELNDLRERVMQLKEEKDKILRHLAEHGFDNEKQYSEISSETYLGYIQRLTLEKKGLAGELLEKEQGLLELRGRAKNWEEKSRLQEEERQSLKEELVRVCGECEKLRKRADEKEKEASRCLEMVNRREAEFSSDLQEKELQLRSGQSERERMACTVSEMRRLSKRAEEEARETAEFLQELLRLEKDKFASIIAEVRQK